MREKANRSFSDSQTVSVEQAEQSQSGQSHGDDPEAGDHLGFCPAGQLKVMMERAHFKHASAGRLVRSDLDHDGSSLDQEDAALTIGANRLQTFWHVTLPAIRWGLLYGVSLTFARAVGEIGAVLVVSGGVSRLTETSTLFIFRSLDDRNYVGANAMAVVLAGISFAILMVIEFLKKRTERA